MPAGTSTTRRPRLRSRGQNTRPGRLRTLAGRSKCVQFAPTASFSSFAYAVSCGSHCVRKPAYRLLSPILYIGSDGTHTLSRTLTSQHSGTVGFFLFTYVQKESPCGQSHLSPYTVTFAQGQQRRGAADRRCAAPADPKTGHYDVKIPRRAGRTPRAPCRGCGLRPDQTLHGPRLLRGLHRDRARGQPT